MCAACGASTFAYAASTADASFANPVYGGAGPAGSTTLGATGNASVDGVISGVKWSGSSLTYSFPTLASQYEAGYSEAGQPSFAPVTAAVQTAVRYALGLVSQYTNLATTEIAATSTADIRVAVSDSANPTAYAYYPGSYTQAGDVWMGTAYPEYQSPIKGQYAWATILHELGHSLGLKHGHETTGGVAGALDTVHDQMAYSIMTYRSYQGGPLTGYSNELNGYAQTYMMSDIAALQAMYGANFTTNATATTYTWSTTTGEMFINGVGQGAPGGNRIFMTIWDGGGIDTYDFSNQSANLSVNLAPGNASMLSTTQRALLGSGQNAPGEIFNAFQYNGDARSLIENANGGTGNDTINGNIAANVLHGNGGTDTLYGLDGADTLYGDDGTDTLYGGTGADQLYGGNGNDMLYFDAADTAVDGGAGDDSATYQDVTTGLRTYNMAGHGIEHLYWVTSGDAFRLDLNANGSRTEIETDTAANKTFLTRTTEIDSLLRVDTLRVVYDTGAYDMTDYDQAGTLWFQESTAVFNTSGLQTRWYGTRDGGDVWDYYYNTANHNYTATFEYDLNNDVSWYRYASYYTTVLTIQQIDIINDDTTYTKTAYDVTGAAWSGSWFTYSTEVYNASNQKTRWYGLRDSGDSWDYYYTAGTNNYRATFEYDANNDAAWARTAAYYTADGLNIQQRDTLNDNGTYSQTVFDVAGAPWAGAWFVNSTEEFNSAGQRTRWYGLRDTGDSWDYSYNAANGFRLTTIETDTNNDAAWTTMTTFYDATNHATLLRTVYDNHSIVDTLL